MASPKSTGAKAVSAAEGHSFIFSQEIAKATDATDTTPHPTTEGDIVAASEADEGCKTFTCFLDLPVEIQLKIWRDCFPDGRMVWLRIQRDQDRAWDVNKLPVTLHVNHQSRDETPKHYYVFLPPIMEERECDRLWAQAAAAARGDFGYSHDLPYYNNSKIYNGSRDGNSFPQPISFNPKRDTPWFSMWAFVRRDHSLLREQIEAQCPGLYDSITHLAFENPSFFLNNSINHFMHDPRGGMWRPRNVLTANDLLAFRNLEKVTLNWVQKMWHENKPSENDISPNGGPYKAADQDLIGSTINEWFAARGVKNKLEKPIEFTHVTEEITGGGTLETGMQLIEWKKK